MEESSANVSPVDTSTSVEGKPTNNRPLEPTSFYNEINESTSTSSESEARTISPKCSYKRSYIPVPSSSSKVNYLAEHYWKYPTVVHQEFVVSPFQTNQVFLAKARRKSEKLQRELRKEPERHRGTQGQGTSSNNRHRGTISNTRRATEVRHTDSRKSKANNTLVAKSPVPQRRRTVNQAIVNQANNKNKNVNINRRLTVQMNPIRDRSSSRVSRKESRKPTTTDDASAALAEFRKGMFKSSGNESEKAVVYAETPIVLDALREQREDLEKREELISQSANLVQLEKKCCGVFKKCVWSHTVKCVAFFALVVVIIVLSITAIVFPIVKAVLDKKG